MKKSGYLSIGVVVFLILASLSSVIVFAASQPRKEYLESPLFAVRTAQSTNTHSRKMIQSRYLGKGENANLFPSSQLTLQSQVDKALKIISNNPLLVKKVLKKISDSPQVIRIFLDYGLSISKVTQYISQVKDNPEILSDQLMNVDFTLPLDDEPKPMGLNTSNPFGCVIVIIALLPLAIAIGIVIATITLVTCLNIGNCAQAIIEAILHNLAQELLQR